MTVKKTKQVEEFATKEFNVYFPFASKAADCKDCGNDPCTCEMEGHDGKVLEIKGWANFAGNLDDEASIFVDHAGDVIVPSGFDLKTWNKNPQILWQHDRNYTIGKGLKATKKKEGLEITAEIHEKAMEEEDFYKVDKGLVTMLSVGFRTMAGEYKEINKRNVFFITKALLYEVSVVSIPCNSESGFSIVKSLEDGSLYAGEIDFNPKTESPSGDNHKTTHKDEFMQTTLREQLPEDKVKELEALGLGASLDEPQEINTKAYIAATVSKSVADALAPVLEAFKADIIKLITPEEPAATDEPNGEAEPTEPEGEVNSPEGTEEAEKEAQTEAVKSLSDSVTAAIKALTAE